MTKRKHSHSALRTQRKRISLFRR